MSDCVDREAVIKAIDRILNPCTDMTECITLSHLKEDIERLPAVEPGGAKGHWINLMNGEFRCSVCNQITEIPEPGLIMDYLFCPWCGADMRMVEQREKPNE